MMGKSPKASIKLSGSANKRRRIARDEDNKKSQNFMQNYLNQTTKKPRIDEVRERDGLPTLGEKDRVQVPEKAPKATTPIIPDVSPTLGVEDRVQVPEKAPKATTPIIPDVSPTLGVEDRVQVPEKAPKATTPIIPDVSPTLGVEDRVQVPEKAPKATTPIIPDVSPTLGEEEILDTSNCSDFDTNNVMSESLEPLVPSSALLPQDSPEMKKTERVRGKAKKGKFIATFTTEKAAIEHLEKEGLWAARKKYETTDSCITIYRCKKAKSRGPQCAASRYIVRPKGVKNVYDIYDSIGDHDHDKNYNETKQPLSTEVKALIDAHFPDDRHVTKKKSTWRLRAA
ncbi:hypothetical protein DMENIID0001_038470 [Sergentomyia squamirostris]